MGVRKTFGKEVLLWGTKTVVLITFISWTAGCRLPRRFRLVAAYPGHVRFQSGADYADRGIGTTGTTQAQIAILLQNAMFVAGIATSVQLYGMEDWS